MKILVFSNITGGIWSFRKELLEALLLRGNQVFIGAAKTKNTDLLSDMGCELYNIPVDRRGTNPVKDIKLFIKYLKLLKRLKPDVVLTYTIKPNVYGGLACAFLKIPYISNVTGLGSSIGNKGMMCKITSMLYKIGLRKADTVFFQNKANQEYFQKYKLVRGYNELIPGSGVNLKQHCFEEYPEEGDKIGFLFIGRVMKDKGIDELIECTMRIKEKYPNIKFSLIGGYDEKEYKDKLDTLEKQGVLKYLGYQNNVHPFIKNHHATILPSYHEGLANVLLETAACGRPVIASNIPGCKETFDEGLSGFGFEARNADDLFRTVERFIELPYEKKKQMGIHGRKKVEEEFSRDIIVQAYLKAIDKIVIKEKKVNGIV